MYHVILGAGPAGVIAAEMLRKYDADSRITLIGGEDEPPYSRMAIPYYLSGQIGAKGTHLRPGKGYYKDLDIAYRKARAGKLNTKKQRLTLEGGKEIDYDRLLIATGASPIKPKIDGLKLRGVHTCWTLDDARAIAKLAKKGQPVVLVGAGFIGSIILEALAAKGVDLTVVEMGDRMVPRMMDETAGNMLRRWCEEHGVRVLTKTRVRKITRGKHGLNAQLSNGEKAPARLIVIATGVASNMSFLKGSGIKCGAGIAVDDRLRTSAPGVFAAGDVAQGRDLSTGQFSVLAIQPTAVEHGRIAALNMAGLDTPYVGGLNMNVLDTLGLVSSSFGAWEGVKGGKTARTGNGEGWRYLRLEFKDDRLVGAQAVGMTDNIGMLRGLIQTGLRLGAWRDRLMRAPERLAEAYVATAQGIPPV